MKEFLASNMRWFRIAFAVMLVGLVFSLVMSFLFPVSPEESGNQISQGLVGFPQVEEVGIIGQIWLIALHNFTIGVVNLVGGLTFGLLTVFNLLQDGGSLPMLLLIALAIPPHYLLLFLPFTLMEYFSMLLTGTWGIKLGLGWIDQPKGERLRFIRNTFVECIDVALFCAVMLIVAAAIEVYMIRGPW